MCKSESGENKPEFYFTLPASGQVKKVEFLDCCVNPKRGIFYFSSVDHDFQINILHQNKIIFCRNVRRFSGRISHCHSLGGRWDDSLTFPRWRSDRMVHTVDESPCHTPHSASPNDGSYDRHCRLRHSGDWFRSLVRHWKASIVKIRLNKEMHVNIVFRLNVMLLLVTLLIHVISSQHKFSHW